MERFGNKGLSIVLAVVLSAILAAPSVQAIKRHKYRRDYRTNQWSLGLLFDSHPDDGQYDATTLSLRRQYSRHHAWRLNLTGVQRTLESGQNRVFHGSQYTWGFVPNHDIGLDGGEISFQQMVFPSADRDGVDFYWAIGPRFAALDADNDVFLTFYDDPALGGADYVKCDQVTRMGLGLQGALGLEWFMGRHVSLLGELGINVEKRWYVFRIEYYNDHGGNWSDTDVFGDDVVVESPWVNLGFAVHF